MKKYLMLIIILVLSGCMVSDRENFKFQDTHDDILNEEICFDFCMNRETHNPFGGNYHCDYKPVICVNEECVCRTY